MRSRTACLLALSLLVLAQAAHATGVIRGTVKPKPRPASAAAARKRGSEVTDAVIYVERLPDPVERKLNSHGFWFFRRVSPPRVRRLVEIQHHFDPHVLAIAVGDRIEFQNLDRVYHSPFSVSVAKHFDIGKRLPGARETVTMDRPGVINLHCEIHPDMGGYVVVTPNHAFAFPNDLGQYRLLPLPPGTYTVHVFHPRWGELQRKVEIAKNADAALDLAY